MTLHEAMIEVLRLHGGWMDRDSLAAAIAERDLYRQRAGGPPPSDQLRLRARKYPHLFDCSDVRCSRIRVRDVSSPPGPAQQHWRKRGSRTNDPAVVGAELAWYDALRNKYRPAKLEVLLIGESPPDPGSGQKRFFYAPQLTHDNLYRGVAEAAYGNQPGFDVRDKVNVLQRLQYDGFWLIDAAEHPINKTSASSRRAAIKQAAPLLVERCLQLQPHRGVIICHGLVFEYVAAALQAAKVPLLQDKPLPFPLGNWRAQFISGFREALASPTDHGPPS